MPLIEEKDLQKKSFLTNRCNIKVSIEVQEAFDQLAERTYLFTRTKLLRAPTPDCLKRHEQL